MLVSALHAGPPADQKAAGGAQQAPKTFATAQEAADALIQAAGHDDANALVEIFGADGKNLVETGDEVQDKNGRASFAKLAEQQRVVAPSPSNKKEMILSVGDEGWPLPVPIVKQKGKWHFDAKKGHQEILDRRIGANELDTIEVCRGYVEAQKSYAKEIHDDSGMLQYAQRFISNPPKHDGLYWRNADGSAGGPIGEAIAKAMAEGYSSKTEPYHGYYYRVLKAQGPAAPLGALDYVVNGAMIGGFALVAWPAEYRVTGVQTFLINHDGVLYEKDLGTETQKIASAMERYNPDKGWKVAQAEE